MTKEKNCVIKPLKEIYLGTHILCLLYGKAMEIYKDRLWQYYHESKSKYALDGGAVWCEYMEPEFIERLHSFADDPFYPLNQSATIAIKWLVRGRAFYIDRTFRSPKQYKRYPNKKNVPKKLRGKPIVKRHKH